MNYDQATPVTFKSSHFPAGPWRWLGSVLVLLTGFTATALGAGLVYETVRANGRGITPREAIQDALVEAVSQVNGTSIEARQIRTQLEAVVAIDGDALALSSELFVSKVATATKGVIKSYRVLSNSKAPNGIEEVQVNAVVARYELGAETQRKRMVVLPFRLGEGAFQSMEGPLDKPRLERRLRQMLIDQLVQTRRFAVLDRDFEQELTVERQRLSSPTASMDERAKLGRELGADYFITGSFEQFRVSLERIVFPGSGREMEQLNVAAELSYRVIELATGQTVFSDTFRMPVPQALPMTATTPSDVEARVLDAVSRQIGVRIVSAIYPLRVVSVLREGEVVLNQGGSSLQVGQRLDAFQLGKKLTDPYTKEFIGYEELAAATLEITRVLPKTTYAKVITAKLSLTEGAICRPQVTGAFGQATTNTTGPNAAKTKAEIDALFK